MADDLRADPNRRWAVAHKIEHEGDFRRCRQVRRPRVDQVGQKRLQRRPGCFSWLPRRGARRLAGAGRVVNRWLQMRHPGGSVLNRCRIAEAEPHAADIGLVREGGRQRFDDDWKAEVFRRSRRLGDRGDAKRRNGKAEARQRGLGLSLVEHARRTRGRRLADGRSRALAGLAQASPTSAARRIAVSASLIPLKRLAVIQRRAGSWIECRHERGFGRTIEPRIHISRRGGGSARSAVQQPGFSPEISFNPRRRLESMDSLCSTIVHRQFRRLRSTKMRHSCNRRTVSLSLKKGRPPATDTEANLNRYQRELAALSATYREASAWNVEALVRLLATVATQGLRVVGSGRSFRSPSFVRGFTRIPRAGRRSL